MLALLAVTSNGGGASNGALTADQTIAIIISTVLLTVLSIGVKRLSSIDRNSRAVMSVLVTAEPSKLNPNPPLGFLALVHRHDKMLGSLDKTVGVLLVGQKAVLNQRVAERSDNGHDLRPQDALNLIEREQHRRAQENFNDE